MFNCDRYNYVIVIRRLRKRKLEFTFDRNIANVVSEIRVVDTPLDPARQHIVSKKIIAIMSREDSLLLLGRFIDSLLKYDNIFPSIGIEIEIGKYRAPSIARYRELP